MSRYTGPRLKITRRLGSLPGLTTKKPTKRQFAPGEHGRAFTKKQKSKRNKLSQYSLGLLEKQKLRYNYGITERQLFNYVKKARWASESSGDVLLQLLEMRLDNIIYRLQLATSISAARQLINHGHVLVNGSLVSFPSYQCKALDEIQLKTHSKPDNSDVGNPPTKERVIILKRKVNKKKLGQYLPNYLSFNYQTSVGKINNLADKKSIHLKINELLVIEFYSRKF